MANIHTHIHAYRQTDKQTDKQTDRQTCIDGFIHHSKTLIKSFSRGDHTVHLVSRALREVGCSGEREREREDLS